MAGGGTGRVGRSAGGRNWLSLDRGENEPVSFWTYVIAALRTVASGVGESALALLHAPQPPPIETVLTELLNDLGALPGDIVLVLDDYHVVDALDVQDGMAFLLEHLPPWLHVVIASRTDPALPLARWRARGELVEIRAAELRFTPDEAAVYLNAVYLLLPRGVTEHETLDGTGFVSSEVINVQVGEAGHPLERQVDEPLERCPLLCAVERPSVLIAETTFFVSRQYTEEVFKSSLADERIAFEVKKNVARRRSWEPEESFIRFAAERLKFQPAFDTGFHLNSRLFSNPRVALACARATA